MDQKTREKIIESVMNDKRSKEEAFESLKRRVQAMYNNTLSEEEVVGAANRLIGVFQVMSDRYDREQLEKQLEKAKLVPEKTRTKKEQQNQLVGFSRGICGLKKPVSRTSEIVCGWGDEKYDLKMVR